MAFIIFVGIFNQIYLPEASNLMKYSKSFTGFLNFA